MKCIAKKRPVIIWMIKHRPNREPKFHQIDRFIGAGRSITELEIIFKRGCDFRRGRNIIQGERT